MNIYHCALTWLDDSISKGSSRINLDMWWTTSSSERFGNCILLDESADHYIRGLLLENQSPFLRDSSRGTTVIGWKLLKIGDFGTLEGSLQGANGTPFIAFSLEHWLVNATTHRTRAAVSQALACQCKSERTSKAWEEKIISKDMPILQGRSSAANKFILILQTNGQVWLQYFHHNTPLR